MPLIKKSHPHGWDLLGASDEARTRYLHLGKVALYQMSYTRSDRNYYNTVAKNVKGEFLKCGQKCEIEPLTS